MKGLVLLFIVIVGSVIAWGYATKAQKHRAIKWVGANAWAVLIALVTVAAAVLFSANTTLRFL